MTKFNPLQKIDDGMLYLANRGVQAWNWTTGRTKYDLSTVLHMAATASDGAGYVLSNDPNYLLIFSISVFTTGICTITNELNNRREKNSSDVKVKPYLDDLDIPLSRFALGFSGWEFISAQMHKPPMKYTILANSVAFFSRSLAFYVNRAESLPLRKNVLARATEILKESSQPLPEFCKVGVNQRLEAMI
ncbi:hypothetical protein J4474_00940 [Candidatus Pacearchaeota archaeon]|nr:hypothetical protein [Candidatus Pacearchaeota archaeon]